MRKYYIFIIILTLIVVSVVVIGFKVGGAPATLQEITLDSKRIGDFEMIKQAIDIYFKDNNKLPVSINELNIQTKLADPTTNKPYQYETMSQLSYKLCTEFSTDSNQTENMNPSSSSKKHKKGYDCIAFQVSNNKLSNLNDLSGDEIYQKRLSGNDFTSLLGKQYFLIETIIDVYPKGNPPNTHSGALNVGDTQILLDPNSSHLYEVKDHNSEYFLALYTSIINLNPSCKNDPSSGNCSYNLQWIDLKTEDGTSIRRNIKGIKNYIDTSTENGFLQEIGSFPKEDIFYGSLGFFVPKMKFENSEKTAIFLLTYNFGKTYGPTSISVKIK